MHDHAKSVSKVIKMFVSWIYIVSSARRVHKAESDIRYPFEHRIFISKWLSHLESCKSRTR